LLPREPVPGCRHIDLWRQGGARLIFAEDNALGSLNGFHVLFEGMRANPVNTTPQYIDKWNNQPVLVTLLHLDLDVFGRTEGGTTLSNFLLDIRLLEAVSPAVVPLPAGGWLLLSFIGALVVVRRRKTAA